MVNGGRDGGGAVTTKYGCTECRGYRYRNIRKEQRLSNMSVGHKYKSRRGGMRKEDVKVRGVIYASVGKLCSYSSP